jgi:hypothetical protein
MAVTALILRPFHSATPAARYTHIGYEQTRQTTEALNHALE